MLVDNQVRAAAGIRAGQLWRREWQVKQQGAIQWLYPLVLFLVIITLFPLAVGSEPQLLQRLGVSAVWIAALLSLVMGVDGLFKPALDNGTLAQLIGGGKRFSPVMGADSFEYSLDI